MPVGTFNNITADSTPVFDKWGYDTFWGCEHWVLWHSKMAEKYGIKHANDTFLLNWEQNTFGASVGDCTTFNPAFMAYAKKAGFYTALFSGIAFLTYPIAVVTDLVYDAGKIIDNAGNSIVNVSSMLRWLAPVLVVGAGIVAGIYVKNRFLPSPKRSAK